MASELPNRPTDMTENMVRLQMRVLRQKMNNALTDQQRPYALDGEDQHLNQNKIRYHQSLLKRQELIERLKAANQREGERPAMPASPNQDIRIPSRVHSLPELPRDSKRERNGLARQDNDSPVYEVTESLDDQVFHNRQPSPRRPAERQYPVQTQPPLPQPQSLPPPPPLYVGAHPQYPPAFLYPQHQTLGAPLILPFPGNQPQGNKSEYFDMMMMQNAQMHQLFMQQLLVRGLNPSKEEPQTVVFEQPTTVPPQPQFITIPQNKRPKSKHHHHYSQLPPISNERSYQINHIQHVETRASPPPPPPPQRIYTAVSEPQSYPKRKEGRAGPDDPFLFGIQLKEAVGALHRIYLNPDGNIYPLLNEVISPGATDLTKAFTANPKIQQELVYLVENVVFHMTDIMPRTGVLGTHKKAAVFEMLQPGKTYPDGYFWKVESDMLPFDEQGRTTQVNEIQSQLLLFGMFISRSLVTTLLMKPLDYGLSTTILDDTAEGNLRLISSLILYIARKVSVPKNSPLMVLPYEVSRHLYTDAELQPLLSKIQPTIDYADELLRNWTKEYISRLSAAKTQQ